MTDTYKLLVIGGGPKALALAAKIHVLRRLGVHTPTLEIIEQHEVGANWSGRFGFTDGECTLGTTPEKDVGYPYRSSEWKALNDEVNRRMQRFSWSSFLVSQGDLPSWVDRQRSAPTHRHWAKYLRWVARTSAARVIQGRVERVAARDTGRWALECKTSRGTLSVEGCGLVLTGPGKARRCLTDQFHSRRILDGQSFWSALPRLKNQTPKSLAVIGCGETAASVCIRALDLWPGCEVSLFAPKGICFSRGEGFIENRVFSDPGSWAALSRADREETLRRTDRAVVSPEALAALARFDTFHVVRGRVQHLNPGPKCVDVEYAYEGRKGTYAAEVVVDATGFDPLALLREAVLSPEQAHVIFASDVRERIGHDLSVDGFLPKLFLPMLAGLSQGPGFPNLSCLGLMSDRILRPLTAQVPAETEPRGKSSSHHRQASAPPAATSRTNYSPAESKSNCRLPQDQTQRLP